MIVRITLHQCVSMVGVIQFVRTIGKIGLKDAKTLVETLKVYTANQPNGYELSGTLRLKVDPVFALPNLLAAFGRRGMVVGMTVEAEADGAVVDLSV